MFNDPHGTVWSPQLSRWLWLCLYCQTMTNPADFFTCQLVCVVHCWITVSWGITNIKCCTVNMLNRAPLWGKTIAMLQHT